MNKIILGLTLGLFLCLPVQADPTEVALGYRQQYLEPLRASLLLAVFTDYYVKIGISQQDINNIKESSEDQNAVKSIEDLQFKLYTWVNQEVEDLGGDQITPTQLALIDQEAKSNALLILGQE